MPSNAQMFTDYYAVSVVDYWDKQRREARDLLVRERGEQDAYIRSLESAIRAADDDIRGWAQVSDARERANRQSIIQADRNRAYAARARSRATNSAIRGATSAMTKVESRLAQSSTGQAETASAFEGAQGRDIPDSEMIASLTSQMGGVGTDLAKDIAKYGLERGGTADETTRLAAAHGIRRTLRETARRNPDAGISENVINGVALNLVGLENTAVNRSKIGTYNEMVQAEGARAARTVQSAPTGAAGAVQVADDLEARGFAPFDFLPEMEVDALKARREKMQADLAAARAQRAGESDLDAMLEQEMARRSRGVGEGLQFGGGLLGAIQFGAHNRRRMEAANARLSAAQAESNRLGAMSENEKLLYGATARARQSFNRFGSLKPDGANETLWQLGGQIATMNKGNHFKSLDNLVQQARQLISDTEEGGLNQMSPEQKQVALNQLLEFASMQQLDGWEAPQPAFQLEDETITAGDIEERIDPSTRLRNETQRANTATRRREQAEANIQADSQERKQAIRVEPLEFDRTPTRNVVTAGGFLANRYRADVNPMSPLREQQAVYLKEQAIRQALGDETEDAPRMFGGDSPMTLESESYLAPTRLEPESYMGDPVSGVEFAPLEDLLISSEDDLLLAALDR
tara:strand:+ start:5440 stop:7347 length:1908 start_codon:yes stop_codon:yes gene_type:complete